MKMLIDGEWITHKEVIEVHDPYNDKLIDTVPRATLQDVQLAIKSASEAFSMSKKLPAHQRAAILYITAEIITSRKEEYAKTFGLEGYKNIIEER